jgi:hypothetical protein
MGIRGSINANLVSSPFTAKYSSSAEMVKSTCKRIAPAGGWISASPYHAEEDYKAPHSADLLSTVKRIFFPDFTLINASIESST